MLRITTSELDALQHLYKFSCKSVIKQGGEWEKGKGGLKKNHHITRGGEYINKSAAAPRGTTKARSNY